MTKDQNLFIVNYSCESCRDSKDVMRHPCCEWGHNIRNNLFEGTESLIHNGQLWLWLIHCLKCSESAGLPSNHRQASSPRSPGPAWTQKSGRNTTSTSRLKIQRGSTAWLKSSSPSSTWTTILQSSMKNSWKRQWSLVHLSESRYIMLNHPPLPYSVTNNELILLILCI